MLKLCDTCSHGGRITAVHKSPRARYMTAACIRCELNNASVPSDYVCSRYKQLKNENENKKETTKWK